MIDKAPTIPKERAIFPEITVVITKPIKGKIQNVVTLEKVLAQFWPESTRDILIKAPIKIAIRHFKINVIEIPKKIKSINLLIII